ncbi:predicted protein [Chaetomium globosum CBS 148.51]|uniref:Uncharacterized protein n=1 Tax=Chaetomium globosum (strain ATCC 6205 / CBS 148.51 / DSM 1962 / NBRC 6347 / NRRL 1970) TaxID=306901 RepID=Q2HHF4_CHAGB|nr:uncharacterized protein CHGG_00350 [Chaetomium globosum CBS 148.51]EAQ92115.1 predicted protein [Chaetomium globosum CBS 148.51]
MSLGTTFGGDCCPNGYMCATATDAPCRLTLRLDFVTETITSTVGSMVSVWTTTSAIDPPSTAADRVPEISSSDSSLTASQIGGIIGGVLGAVLAIITVVVLLIRRRRKELLAAGHSERVFQKGELDGQGWQRAELQEMASGNHIVPAELAGGHSQHELVGSYEAHGTSELHGSRPYYSPLGTNT